ncbi:MAG: KH domain-containing protein [Ruminococcaceae bacterium]|nr:KH domain-containing protein [Oscillospiraceae bacterium]
MIKEAIGFGNTIDEAKEDAIAKLNVSELEDIQIDLIAMPKKKILGLFGGSKAEVRAYIEIAEKKIKGGKKPQPKKEKTVQKQKEAPKAEAQVKEVPKKVNDAPDYGEAVDVAEISAETPAGKAIAYVKAVLSAVGCNEVEIKVQSRENASRILMSGEDLSIVIGRRGETLDSLQYLASLAANNGGGHYKISLNIGDYRERREETLIKLANRISAQVIKTGKSRTLEPMNPYERRIIHTAVQNIEGVVSNSFGEGTGRRVVISVEGAEVRPPRMNDRRRGSYNRSRGQRPNNKVEAPVREPKKDSDIPLYGKIN